MIRSYVNGFKWIVYRIWASVRILDFIFISPSFIFGLSWWPYVNHWSRWHHLAKVSPPLWRIRNLLILFGKWGTFKRVKCGSNLIQNIYPLPLFPFLSFFLSFFPSSFFLSFFLSLVLRHLYTYDQRVKCRSCFLVKPGNMDYDFPIETKASETVELRVWLYVYRTKNQFE